MVARAELSAQMINEPSLTSAPTLTTPRLILRAHSTDDFTDVAAMWSNLDVVRYIGGRPFSATESWARIMRYAGHWALLGYGYWLLEDRQTGQFMGEVGLADHRRETQPSLLGQPEAGWVLAPHAQGQGYAREALACMFEWVDNHLEAPTTVCIIHPEHSRSIQLARAFGFGQEQLIRYLQEPTVLMVRECVSS